MFSHITIKPRYAHKRELASFSSSSSSHPSTNMKLVASFALLLLFCDPVASKTSTSCSCGKGKLIRQLVMHQHASQSNATRRKFLVCFQFHAFFLKVSDIITYFFFFNRGTNDPTCLGGKCSQTNSVSPICTGGQCTQDGSTNASCMGAKCSQVNVKGSASCTWGCDQRGAVNPTCISGGCCRDVLVTDGASCAGGIGQTGSNSCGPNAKGCKLNADVSIEESRFLRA